MHRGQIAAAEILAAEHRAAAAHAEEDDAQHEEYLVGKPDRRQRNITQLPRKQRGADGGQVVEQVLQHDGRGSAQQARDEGLVFHRNANAARAAD